MDIRVTARVGGAEERAELEVPARPDVWKAVADRYAGRPEACVLLVEVRVGWERWEREEAAAGSFQVGSKVVSFVDAWGRLSSTSVLSTKDQGVAASWARAYCPPGQRWVVREATRDSGEQGRVVDPTAGALGRQVAGRRGG